jgi:hypothetical protein
VLPVSSRVVRSLPLELKTKRSALKYPLGGLAGLSFLASLIPLNCHDVLLLKNRLTRRNVIARKLVAAGKGGAMLCGRDR